jgi:hypothetical protein
MAAACGLCMATHCTIAQRRTRRRACIVCPCMHPCKPCSTCCHTTQHAQHVWLMCALRPVISLQHHRLLSSTRHTAHTKQHAVMCRTTPLSRILIRTSITAKRACAFRMCSLRLASQDKHCSLPIAACVVDHSLEKEGKKKGRGFTRRDGGGYACAHVHGDDGKSARYKRSAPRALLCWCMLHRQRKGRITCKAWQRSDAQRRPT